MWRVCYKICDYFIKIKRSDDNLEKYVGRIEYEKCTIWKIGRVFALFSFQQFFQVKLITQYFVKFIRRI